MACSLPISRIFDLSIEPTALLHSPSRSSPSPRKLWTVTYEADNEMEEFDYDDMMKFVVDRVCGTAAADGGAALKRNAETITNGDSVST
eukprot:COSAG01_NODE_4670_length_4830_cov_10.805749_2_plen_89_part_00